MTATEQLQPTPLAADQVRDPAPALAPLGKEVGSGGITQDQAGQRIHPCLGAALVISLPLRIDVKIPVPNFRFKDLAHLAHGQVLKTDWSIAEDLPVATGDVRLLWAEFAVAEQQLTVRVTRVA